MRRFDPGPRLQLLQPDLPLVSLVYGYLKLGLPVLLVLNIPSVGLHGIALNGYSIRASGVGGKRPHLRIVSSN
ncbi:MAG TPA: hypothetical protein VKB38_14615 [Terracidiphilus sp.]|nr:hypothetical protein [Terracidiphilus sp.]